MRDASKTIGDIIDKDGASIINSVDAAFNSKRASNSLGNLALMDCISKQDQMSQVCVAHTTVDKRQKV